MSAILAIAWNGFREARRNRVTIVVAAFAAVMLLSTALVREVTVGTFYRVLTDFGLGTMSLLMLFLAVFLSCGLLPREVERRTIYLMVTKPISRSTFVLARILGNVLTLSILLLAMSALFAVQLELFGVHFGRPHLIATAGLLVELTLLTTAGVFFSTFSGAITASVVTTGLYLAGHLTADLQGILSRSESAFTRGLGDVLYAVVPNLERLNFRPHAAYAVEVPWGTLASGSLYALFWAALFSAAAVLAFNGRDFR